MPTDEGAIILGGFLSFVAFSSFFLNLSVLWILWKYSFLNFKNGGIFILAFANMSGNAFAVFIYGVYLGPATITQSFLFNSTSVYPYPQLIGAIWHAQWFQDLILMAFTALNRLIVIVRPPCLPVFTHTHIVIFIIFAYTAGIFISFLATYVLPCCTLYMDYKTISFAYAVTGPNYSDHFIDYPVNCSCFVISVLCYIRIYWFVKTSNTKIITNLPKSTAENRKSKELKYALQFAACTFCVIAIDIIFHTLPLILPPGADRFYIIISFLEILHSSVNALIFLAFNIEIRKHFFLFKSQSYSSSGPPLPTPQGVIPIAII